MKPPPRRYVLGAAALAIVGLGGTTVLLHESSQASGGSASAPTTGDAATSAGSTTSPTPGAIPQATFTTTTQVTPSYVAATTSATAVPVATDAVTQAPVEVLVTYSGWDAATSRVIAGAVISGLVESDGTCRLDVRQGSTAQSDEAPAVADARTTSCGELGIGDLGSGSWDATITYRSGGTTSTSAGFVVEVP